MRLFEEYGDAQITIFGAVANSQTIGNLPYAKALALLAIPSEEREEFAETVGAEDLSVRELQKAIKERDEERARTKELEERIEELNGARGEAKAAADEAAELREKVKELEAKVEKEKGNAQILKNKLSVAKNDPKIPPEKLEAIKKEAEESAKKDIAENISRELEETKTALKAAEEAKASAEEKQKAAEDKLKATESRLKTANPEVNAFKVMFEALQEQANKCKRQIFKIAETDPEAAERLKAAMKALADSLVK
jgi:chromosome segregation ATPase